MSGGQGIRSRWSNTSEAALEKTGAQSSTWAVYLTIPHKEVDTVGTFQREREGPIRTCGEDVCQGASVETCEDDRRTGTAQPQYSDQRE
jgi:hypothetical protein